MKKKNTIRKLSYISLLLLAMVCYSSCGERIGANLPSPNCIEKELQRDLVTRENHDLQGDVRSFIEYEIYSRSDAKVLQAFPISTNRYYDYVSADTLLRTFNSEFSNSESVLFDRKGNGVKRVTSTKYNGQEFRRYTDTYEYNQRAQLIKKKKYYLHGHHKLGDLSAVHDYRYDKGGRLIRRCINTYDNDLEQTSCANIAYDELDVTVNVVEINSNNGDTIYVLDQVINSNTIFTSLDANERRVLDSDGRVTKVFSVEESTGKERVHASYEFDIVGNVIQEVFYDSIGGIWAHNEYLYKGADLMMVSENEPNRWERTYFDEEGKILRMSSCWQDSIDFSFREEVNEFDEWGNQVESRIVYNGKDFFDAVEKIVTEYDFDKSKNWTESRTFKNDSIMQTKRREISYY